MFGHRTPTKSRRQSQKEEDKPKTNVRRLTGEFEASSSKKEPSPKSLQVTPKNIEKNMSRVERAEVLKKNALLQLSLTRNTKTEIKTEVKTGLTGLYDLLLEAEGVIDTLREELQEEKRKINTEHGNLENIEDKQNNGIKKLQELLEENTKTINKKLEELTIGFEEQKEHYRLTYAETLKLVRDEYTTTEEKRIPLHSLVVASKDPNNTSQEVFDEVRKTLRAKEEGIKINNIRKAKDQKVIIGCKTEEIKKKIKEKLRGSDRFKIEEAVNKNPLVVFKNVLDDNSDADILEALKIQNQHIFENLTENQAQINFLFRKRTRNPQMKHVVARVAPLLWKRLTLEGHVYMDLQRVKVEDQSPLVQCSMCLGYGHSRSKCAEKTPICSNCGGPHVQNQCEEDVECCNCTREGIDLNRHNAFSNNCPVRRKYDILARAMINYF